MQCLHIANIVTCKFAAAYPRPGSFFLNLALNPAFGPQDLSYWLSWALTHFFTLAISTFFCALIGLYAFPHSNFFAMLAFYWLASAALVAFSYVASTLFQKSRVAGMVVTIIYIGAMIPGYLFQIP